MLDVNVLIPDHCLSIYFGRSENGVNSPASFFNGLFGSSSGHMALCTLKLEYILYTPSFATVI